MQSQLTTVLLLLTGLSSPLLAQPSLTLSANTFYFGDVPGTFSVSCPPGTTAGISPLTKVANVPLLNPANNQYSVGAVFPWAAATSTTNTLTGALPQSFTQVVMGGFLIYNMGVLAGTAFCNGGTGTISTSRSFTITLGESLQAQARVTYALKANSVKLPVLGTNEQSTLPPQQAGNLVYNVDEQKMAVHNGSSWQYLSSGQFQNEKSFTTPGTSTWTVPSGVTRIVAEVWGGGAGAPAYNYRAVSGFGSGQTAEFTTRGGAAGSYARGILLVTPGDVLTLVVGQGGSGGNLRANTPATSGLASSIRRNQAGDALFASGGSVSNSTGYSAVPGSGSDLTFSAFGGFGQEGNVSYGQRSATEIILFISFGNGGAAYGVGSDRNGIGGRIAFLPSGQLWYIAGNAENGLMPSGGGGGGYFYGGDGGSGMAIFRW